MSDTNYYEYLWRNKFLTVDAESIDDMIDILQANVDLLKQMKDAGIYLDEGSGIADDYAMLITTDKEVADKFGFEIEDD